MGNGPRKRQIQAWVDATLVERIDAECSRRGVTRSAFVAQACEAALDGGARQAVALEAVSARLTALEEVTKAGQVALMSDVRAALASAPVPAVPAPPTAEEVAAAVPMPPTAREVADEVVSALRKTTPGDVVLGVALTALFVAVVVYLVGCSAGWWAWAF